jgi:uncharacterized protein
VAARVGTSGVTKTGGGAARSPFKFFILVFAIAIPIQLAGRFLGVIGAMNIPVADLGLAFVPMIAAMILVTWEVGWRAAVHVLRETLELKGLRDGRWLAITLGLAPLIYLLTWPLSRLFGAEGIVEFSPGRTLVLLVLFLLLALGEEVGWTGYATEPLQSRWGALGTALILAGPWWLAHLPSMAAVGASMTDVAWWLLGAVGARILIVWLFNHTDRSILSAVLFHALLNTGRSATFPETVSHYAARYQIASYIVMGALAAAVVVFSGLKARRRSGGYNESGL